MFGTPAKKRFKNVRGVGVVCERHDLTRINENCKRYGKEFVSVTFDSSDRPESGSPRKRRLVEHTTNVDYGLESFRFFGLERRRSVVVKRRDSRNNSGLVKYAYKRVKVIVNRKKIENADPNRKPTQSQVMGFRSNEYAKSRGFLFHYSNPPNWLHLSAHAFGELAEILVYDQATDSYKMKKCETKEEKSSQNPMNLVLGTLAANNIMRVAIEDIITHSRQLADCDKICLDISADLLKDEKTGLYTHTAKCIHYNIIAAGKTWSYDFNCLADSSEEQLKYLLAALTKEFLDGEMKLDM